MDIKKNQRKNRPFVKNKTYLGDNVYVEIEDEQEALHLLEGLEDELNGVEE